MQGTGGQPPSQGHSIDEHGRTHPRVLIVTGGSTCGPRRWIARSPTSSARKCSPGSDRTRPRCEGRPCGRSRRRVQRRVVHEPGRTTRQTTPSAWEGLVQRLHRLCRVAPSRACSGRADRGASGLIRRSSPSPGGSRGANKSSHGRLRAAPRRLPTSGNAGGLTRAASPPLHVPRGALSPPPLSSTSSFSPSCPGFQPDSEFTSPTQNVANTLPMTSSGEICPTSSPSASSYQ